MDWQPIVIGFVLLIVICFWRARKTKNKAVEMFAWYLVYILAGLPVFEIISKWKTGMTMSQGYEVFFVQDQWWAWTGGYILIGTIVYLVGHFNYRTKIGRDAEKEFLK